MGFRAGKSPDVYQLCHRDKTTVDRHTSRPHIDDLSQVDVKPYYDESVRKAREQCENHEHRAKSGNVVDLASGGCCNKLFLVTRLVLYII